MDHKANMRIHGTLRERPCDRLIRERPYLKPLPADLSDTYYKEVDRLIQADFCVLVDGRRYSANPDRVGDYAKVRLFKDHLEIWIDDRLDARHLYAHKKYSRNILPEHEKRYKAITGQRRLLEDAFLKLGDIAKTFHQGLKEQKKAAAGYHLQRILRYAERYGADVTAGAMAYAARYGAFSADAILRILQGKHLKKPLHSKPLPENVRQFLEAYDVEKSKPDFYDQIIQQEKQ